MFKWNDDVTNDARVAIANGLDEMAKLPFIANFSHGPDAGVSDGNWDYSVVADFASSAEYRTYADDADHLQLIADAIRPNISARAAVQFEF